MQSVNKRPGAPSMLDLIRLSPNDVRPPGGRSIYRQIALLADLEGAGSQGGGEPIEVLDAPCGAGLQLAYLVQEYRAHGSGVDPDARLVGRADARARELELGERLHFQDAPLDALPYRDEIFDLSIGELGLTSDADPERAVSELVRVTKPGGAVVLLQLVWKAPVEETRRRTLSQHLGVQPLMLVEWKRLLKDAGVAELHTSEWSDERKSLRADDSKPFPEFSERFSFRERWSILRRAWGLWGWRGVRDALAREAEVHRLLTRERILGFVLLKGTKSPDQSAGAPDQAAGATGTAATAAGADSAANAVSREEDLPLFRAPGTADPPLPEPVQTARSTPSEQATVKQVRRADAGDAVPKKPGDGEPDAEKVDDLPLFELD